MEITNMLIELIGVMEEGLNHIKKYHINHRYRVRK